MSRKAEMIWIDKAQQFTSGHKIEKKQLQLYILTRCYGDDNDANFYLSFIEFKSEFKRLNAL